MDQLTQTPEGVAAGELATAFLVPALRVMPEGDGLRAIPEVHHTTRVKDLGFRQGQAQMLQ